MLGAFAGLDVVLLLRIEAVRSTPLTTPDELLAARSRIDALARWLVIAGGGLGAAFVVGWAVLALL